MFFGYEGYYFWNYVVGVVYDDGVVDLDVFVVDFIFVVQGGVGDCDFVYEDGVQLGYWSDGIGMVDLYFDVLYYGQCFLCWEFVGQCKVWGV